MRKSGRAVENWSLRAAWGTALLLAAATARASDLSDIGIVELRSIRPDLTGSGITVGQAEATYYNNPNDPDGTMPYDPQYDADNFEEDSSQTNTSVTPTYVGKLGIPTTTVDSTLLSAHATTVAGNFFGTTTGAAPGVAAAVEYNANYFFDNVICNNVPLQNPLAPANAPAISVVNQSFVFLEVDATTLAQINQIYDDYVANTPLIIVSSVGNSGGPQAPATAYNLIAVGDTDGATSVGPTSDNGRSKPDISAPGGATSYSAPYVSGVAAVLVQAGQTGSGGTDAATEAAAVDQLTVKALLLTGASKPLNWSHTASAPLDPTYGAGMVNAYASYQTLTGGRKTSAMVNASTAPVMGTSAGNAGWDLGTITSTSVLNAAHYLLNITGPSTLSSTLTWNRPAGAINEDGTPVITGINNLDLLLYDAGGNLVDSSTSTVDNVEYLYTQNLKPGIYNLEVVKLSAGEVSSSETYGLAFNAMLLGDANLDGHVDLTDLSTVLNNFGTATNLWTNGNFDGGSTVDLTDLSDVLNNFGLLSGNNVPTGAQSQGLVALAAPEPGSAALLVLAVSAFWIRRRN